MENSANVSADWIRGLIRDFVTASLLAMTLTGGGRQLFTVRQDPAYQGIMRRSVRTGAVASRTSHGPSVRTPEKYNARALRFDCCPGLFW